MHFESGIRSTGHLIRGGGGDDGGDGGKDGGDGGGDDGGERPYGGGGGGDGSGDGGDGGIDGSDGGGGGGGGVDDRDGGSGSGGGEDGEAGGSGCEGGGGGGEDACADAAVASVSMSERAWFEARAGAPGRARKPGKYLYVTQPRGVRKERAAQPSREIAKAARRVE